MPISKHFPIKLQLLLIRAVPLKYALHRQLTIPRVSRSVFIFPVIFLSICYFVSVCRALGKTHSLTSFGCSVGTCGLAMCVAYALAFSFFLFIILSLCSSTLFFVNLLIEAFIKPMIPTVTNKFKQIL